MECNEQCKYFDLNSGCIFAYMGSGNPKDAPCYTELETGKWEKTRINPCMLICSKCKSMFNKDLIYNYYYEDPLIFKYCPCCGAEME